jgi:hypothetical protein
MDGVRALADTSTDRAVNPQQIDMTSPHQQKAYAHTGEPPSRGSNVTKKTKLA